jgi:hypothetical protein
MKNKTFLLNKTKLENMAYALALFIHDEQSDSSATIGGEPLQTDVVVLTRPWAACWRLFMIAAYRRAQMFDERKELPPGVSLRNVLWAIETACPPGGNTSFSDRLGINDGYVSVNRTALVENNLTRALLTAADCDVFGDLLRLHEDGVDIAGRLISRCASVFMTLYGWLPRERDDLLNTPYVDEPLLESDQTSFAELCTFFSNASDHPLSYIALHSAPVSQNAAADD